MISGSVTSPDAGLAAGGRIPPPLPPSPPPPTPEVEAAPYEVPEHLKEDRSQQPRDAGPGEKDSKPDRKTLKETVEKLNKIAEGLGHRLAFGLYDVTDEFYSKVIDRRTNKILKLLPAREVLEFHRKLQETIGAILDEKA